MKIQLATPLKARVGNTSKDARLKNAYAEVRGKQSVVRHRPSARGGVAVGSGVAQGGYGLVLFWADTPYVISESTGTSWNSGTSYSVGDHVSVGFVDYWAINDNTNSEPPSADWSDDYVPAEPVPAYATWGNTLEMVLSGGDLIATQTDSTENTSVVSTIGKSTGKWYWEISVTDTTFFGVMIGDTLPPVTSWRRTLNVGVVGGIALDMDSGIAYFYKNNVLDATRTGLTGTIYAMAQAYSTGAVAVTANFGATAFVYAPPVGYNSGLYT